jgi:tripartite-type tricarboxylate transporter receptor subunit TctC
VISSKNITWGYDVKALKMNQVARTWVVSLCMLAAGYAGAQNFPNKTLRIIVPAGPGSAVDVVARDLTPGLSDALGQQVIVENRPGGNSSIGAREVARAAADGHTMLHGNVNNALNDLLSPQPCCKLNEALVPVTRMTSSPLVLVAHPSVPANNLKELIALAKSQPDQLTFASGGPGSITQLLGELVKLTASVRMREVPYKAIGAEMPDLLAGHVMVAYLAPSVVAQHIKAGKLKGLGVAGPRRVQIIPDVPTLAEAGLAGVEAAGWNGLFVPAGTPAPVILRLQQDTAKVMASAAWKNQSATMGYELGGESPQEFGQFVRQEIQKWQRVIQDARIRVE